MIKSGCNSRLEASVADQPLKSASKQPAYVNRHANSVVSRVFPQPPTSSHQTAPVTRQPAGTLSSSGVSHLILGQGAEMGARTASGDETRVALGIRVGLNYSAPGSQNIFIFIVSPAHLSARSSLSLPEHILFLRPHKYLNQLMTPLEELKGSVSQHPKVGSGTR